MKEYQVCAIGNAMVDYEIKVNDGFLKANKIEKGLMTLVDETRQVELIEAVDGKITKKEGGGSAANTMAAFSQLGGKGFYSCKVANDEDGKFYLQTLLDNGLNTNLDVNNLPDGTTGKCLVMITPDAERTMNTFLGITTDFSVNELSSEAIKKSEYIYLEGALISSPTGRLAMKEAKRIAQENDVRVSLTFWDPSMVKYFKKEMTELVGEGIDLVFCNEEEGMIFTDTSSALDAREALREVATNIVMTKGKNGAMIWNGATWIDIEPYPVQAVDSTGAGDMFAGAFLYGITNGHSFTSSGKLASLASSQVVSKFGPRLTSGQLSRILTQISATAQ